MSRAIVFDPDQVEHLNDLDKRPRRLGRSKLLWVDIDRAAEEDATKVGDAFGLDRETRDRLAGSKVERSSSTAATTSTSRPMHRTRRTRGS